MENENLEVVNQNQLTEDVSEYTAVPKDFILTDMFVQRVAFDSKKEAGKKLFAYSIEKSLTVNAVTKNFSISVVPAIKFEEAGDLKGYMLLDLIFSGVGAEGVPIYLQKFDFEGKTIVKYFLALNTSEGMLAQPLKPRGTSDKTLLDFFCQKYLKVAK